MRECDFLIVGAGIAGASGGYGLCRHGRVIVLEQESQPGYHTTGRSAAFFAESYGNEYIRALTTGSKSFFNNPPNGFSPSPLVGDRGAVYVAREDQVERLHAFRDAVSLLIDDAELLDRETVLGMVPVLRPDYVAAGMWDRQCRDIDVAAVHQGYLRTLRDNGGEVVTRARVESARRHDGRWQVEAGGETYCAPLLVNAAGAWGDEVAQLAGAAPVGLTPMRRTIVILDAPEGLDCSPWPLLVDVDEAFYFKPESGGILATPADETPMAPCDVQPEELDVAIAVDRIQQATSLEVRRIRHRWAGLRTFAPDRTIVAGMDPEVPGFFWLVGQGGYGIATSPAMSEVVASLVVEGRMPGRLERLGVTADALSPARFRQGA